MSLEDLNNDARLYHYSKAEVDKFTMTEELQMHARKGCIDKNECLEGDFGGEQICDS